MSLERARAMLDEAIVRLNALQIKPLDVTVAEVSTFDSVAFIDDMCNGDLSLAPRAIVGALHFLHEQSCDPSESGHLVRLESLLRTTVGDPRRFGKSAHFNRLAELEMQTCYRPYLEKAS